MRFLGYSDQIVAVFALAGLGMPMVVGVFEDSDDPRSDLRIGDATMAVLQGHIARRSHKHDVSMLYGQALVSLWSNLEALIDDFLAAWLTHYEGAMQADSSHWRGLQALYRRGGRIRPDGFQAGGCEALASSASACRTRRSM